MKVIAIPDKTRVIINEGFNQNDELRYGDSIEIFSPSLPLHDPDTGEYIADFGITKDTLSIVAIYENYSILRKKSPSYINPAYSLSNIISPLLLNSEIIVYKELDVEISKEAEYETSKTIKIGDFARKVYKTSWQVQRTVIR